MLLLVGSSLCFLIPAFRNYKRKRHIDAAVCASTCVASALFWMNPRCPSRRYALDKATAYSCFTFHMWKKRNSLDKRSGACLVSIIVSSMGSRLSFPRADWKLWHLIFHMSSTCGMWLTTS